ncbi:OmpA family protein [Neisseriaceae bacterium PsAf]|nr:OmpA family protein [Neisseriaceae bacterium PsAf]
MWGIICLLVLLLLILFGYKSCQKQENIDDNNNANLVVNDANVDENNEVKDGVLNSAAALFDKQIDFFGQKLKVRSGGLEEQIIQFLKSDEYANATEESLKDKWFDFDNVNFKFNSSTELTDDSDVQLQNIAAILSQYPEAKIKIGGYTDKVGDEKVNQQISQQRAEYLKQKLIELGVPTTTIVSAEGYGSEYATVDANASDEERAVDRHMSIRFTK